MSMGVYLPNMEMPKHGHTITITIVCSGQAYVEYIDCRPPVKETIEYTAVPVPPHGRLGDLDIQDVQIEALIERHLHGYTKSTEVLVCNEYGHIWLDTFDDDPDYGVGFETNGDMDGLVAWMPLPQPPEEE